MRRLTYTPALALLLLAAMLIATGCGGTDEIAERAAEKAIEEQTGGKVDIDSDGKDGSVTIKDKDGEMTIGSGGNAKVPDDWPDELKLPDGAEVVLSSTAPSNEGTITTVSATTEESVQDMAKLFDEQLSEWKQDSKADFGSGTDAIATRSYSQDGMTATVSIAGAADQKTTISLGLATK